jgi:hypothetical protein
MNEGTGNAGRTSTDDGRAGAHAEVASVIETASKVAHEGLAPGADGPRVLAGLVLQLAEQVARLTEPSATGSGIAPDRSPNETEAPAEEDRSPREATADPARSV